MRSSFHTSTSIAARNNATNNAGGSLSSAHNKKNQKKKSSRKMMRTRTGTRSASAQHSKNEHQDDYNRSAATAHGATTQHGAGAGAGGAGDYFSGNDSIVKTHEQLSTLLPSLPTKQENHMKTSFRSQSCQTHLLLPTSSRIDQKDSGVAHDSILLPSRTDDNNMFLREKGVDNDAIIVSSATRMPRGRMQEFLLDDAVYCYPKTPLEKMHLFLDGLPDLIKHPGSSPAIKFPLKVRSRIGMPCHSSCL
jgi:hypothetical protein